MKGRLQSTRYGLDGQKAQEELNKPRLEEQPAKTIGAASAEDLKVIESTKPGTSQVNDDRWTGAHAGGAGEVPLRDGGYDRGVGD